MKELGKIMQEEREKMEIRKGGNLVQTKWIYDEKKDVGSYQDIDRTDQAIQYLFERCELEEGVILKDVFLLLNSNIKCFDAVIGNWCEEIVTEGLTGGSTPYNLGKYDPNQIEYLELYYSPQKVKEDGITQIVGFLRPDFHGVGVILQEDSDSETYKKGDRINWGLSLSSADTLVNIPLKLNKKLIVLDYMEDQRGKEKVIGDFDNPEYELGNILYSIIWELSFHGSPKDREKFGKTLLEAKKEFNY